MRISIHVDESQVITEAKFKAAGCSSLVAAASFLTEQVKNEKTSEAATLAQQPFLIVKRLELPLGEGSECAKLACDALIAAIGGYSDSIRDEWRGEEALICTCFGVSETRIEREIEEKNLTTIAEVTLACNAGAGCHSCHPLIEDILRMNDRW